MQYADKIGVSKKLMSLIENQELKEEMIFRCSAYLFFVSAGYLFLKRFYLNELLQFCFWIVGQFIISLFSII